MIIDWVVAGVREQIRAAGVLAGWILRQNGFVYFPIWRPAPLFQVADHRMSRFWEFDCSPGERCESMSGVIVAYPEWVKDPFYYDRLSDGFEPELQTFIKYKKLIDDEYD